MDGALVLSAGGLHAAWQVGCMQSLVDLGLARGQWGEVAGTSAGAFNAACIAQHPPGHEKAALEELKGLWENYSHKLPRPNVPSAARYVGVPPPGPHQKAGAF